jgi:hypothetical protein
VFPRGWRGKQSGKGEWKMSTKRKTMLIGAIVGAIIGAIIWFAEPSSGFIWVWFGIGFGGNIDLIADIPGMFSVGLEREGLWEAIKVTVVGSLIWAIILALFGPIGFLIRFFKNA